MLHDCNWPGCPVKVPQHIYCCKPHWFKIPSIFRHNISRHWSIGDTSNWLEAHKATQEWIKTNADARAR